jgi:hypothetical protein
MSKLRLIPGYESKQFINDPEKATLARWDYPLKMARFNAEESAKRIAESKKLFRWTFFRGDFHSHTQHSDGRGTVAESAEMVKARQLDFQYITDHWGITQEDECKQHGLWLGQEPVTKHHHVGILGLTEAFVPKMDFLEDFAELKRRGWIAFLPHPTGWYPTTIYNKEQTDLVFQLESPFLMEICNGASNLYQAFDYTDTSAIELWDQLLLKGKVVHAMGNTDAHTPHAIGIVWNGIFASQCDEKTILQEIQKGNSFASNGPLVHIQLGKATMGQVVSDADKKKPLQITGVDAGGLSRVFLIVDGKRIQAWDVLDSKKFTTKFSLKKQPKKYLRVEVWSYDGFRAYSNPIYFQK